MKQLKIKKKGFSLAEMMLALALIAALIGITISNAIKATPDIAKTTYKKSLATIESVVTNLLNDEVIYPDNTGFLNTNRVETEFGETFGSPRGETKFRDAFKYKLHISRDNIQCNVFTRAGEEQRNDCFMTSDGIVYGLPDSNFRDNTLVTVNEARLNGGGAIAVRYFPITVYPNWKEISEHDPHPGADSFIFGVTALGKISNLYSGACTGARAERLECHATEYIKADTLKGTEE